MLKSVRELTAALVTIGRREAEAITTSARYSSSIPPDVMMALYEKQIGHRV